ncbi:MAG: hypothetical protein VX777_08235 [Chlamydiota bacterium]|nr:hypothetical protein [Chlamydiota bacterium]
MSFSDYSQLPYDQMPLKSRLDQLKEDDNFQLFSKGRNNGRIITNINAYLDHITLPDCDSKHIEAIRELFFNLEEDERKNFLCGACYDSKSYLFFQNSDKVKVSIFNSEGGDLKSIVLKTGVIFRRTESALANDVVDYISTTNKYVSSAWSVSHYFTTNPDMCFAYRTPGLKINGKVVEGNFPNNEVTSTIAFGINFFPTISPSQLTNSRQKSARK